MGDVRLTNDGLQACSDLCRGEYTAQTDNIKSLFSCAVYTAPTLACIALGIGESIENHQTEGKIEDYMWFLHTAGIEK